MAEQSAPLRVVGLMSGTSMDGIDAAYLETDGLDIVRPGPAVSIPFDPAFRRRLSAFVAVVPERGTGESAAIERELTDLHAEASRRLVADTEAGPSDLD